LLTLWETPFTLSSRQGSETISQTIILADKSYDSQAFIDFIQEKSRTSIIPPKRNRKIQRLYDEFVYQERHLIACFFGKIKHFRRIFSRFHKAAHPFLAFLYFVRALIWLRSFCSQSLDSVVTR
jgi:transposase